MDLITASEALFQELEDDWKAIDEDTDHDETEKEVLKQERQKNYLTALKTLTSRFTSASTSSANSTTTTATAATPAATLVVQSKTNYKLESMSQQHIHKFAEQAHDYQTSTGFSWTAPQIRSFTTLEQRLEIANTFGIFTSEDGQEISDADSWMEWVDNEKLCTLLKEAFPKSAAPTDQQKILAAIFDIQCVKTPRHVGKFIADLQGSLMWEERKTELTNLTGTGFQTLYDALIDKVIGKEKSCQITAEFISLTCPVLTNRVRSSAKFKRRILRTCPNFSWQSTK